MKNNKESGRSAIEILAVLAIIGLLSIGGVIGFRRAMNKNEINSIIHQINLNSIQILAALHSTKLQSADEMDEFLRKYRGKTQNYVITFKAPRDEDRAFTGTEFVAEVADKNGERIKGSMCRKLLTTMIQMNGVSDIDFTVKNEQMEDGSVEDVTMRLSGKAVDLNALCGSDIL